MSIKYLNYASFEMSKSGLENDTENSKVHYSTVHATSVNKSPIFRGEEIRPKL